MNHTTVVPKDAPAEERNTIDYDADSAHDRVRSASTWFGRKPLT